MKAWGDDCEDSCFYSKNNICRPIYPSTCRCWAKILHGSFNTVYAKACEFYSSKPKAYEAAFLQDETSLKLPKLWPSWPEDIRYTQMVPKSTNKPFFTF